MRQGATITVGYDGSRCAGQALRWAADEVADGGGTVRVIGCYSLPVTAEPWYIPPAVDVAAVRASALRLVTGAAEDVARAHPSVQFEAVVSYGPTVEQLVEESADDDLLVVGTHGHGPLDEWRLGSVAHGVIRRARCPVAVVPDRAHQAARGRIVVGVDGSPASVAVLEWACNEADDRDVRLLILHAWDYVYATELGSPTARDLTQVDAALALEAAVRDARARRAGRVDGCLVQGRAAFQLIDEARDADLVVVGSRGRGAVRSRLFGSVSQHVSAGASCPTVIVRDDPAAHP